MKLTLGSPVLVREMECRQYFGHDDSHRGSQGKGLSPSKKCSDG